jgi:hypothetical protein
VFHLAGGPYTQHVTVDTGGWLYTVSYVEEPGDQFTVVFALIVTEPDSECAYVAGWAATTPPPPPLAGSVTIYAKKTVDYSSVLEFSNNLWGLRTK